MESSTDRHDDLKPDFTFGRIFFLLLVVGVFAGHALAFGAWWFLSPKGFGFYLPRFWTNSVSRKKLIIEQVD